MAVPNDLRRSGYTPYRRKTRITGQQKDQEGWTNILSDIIRQTLYREPNLKDYTLFNCIHKTGCRNTQIFYNGIYIGYTCKISGGIYRFYPND